MEPDDDEVWRAIVDNYGERPSLDADDAVDSSEGPEGRPEGSMAESREAHPSRWNRTDPEPTPAPERSWDDEFVDSDWSTDRFVPPPPPPLPHLTGDRLAAWLGVFGSPAILLVCLILGITPPMPIPYILIGGFLGGFLYLVLNMDREPRDPGDDGAVL